MSIEDLKTLLDVAGVGVKSVVGSDGVAVIAGTLDTVEQVDRAITQVEECEHTSYLVQLHIVESRDATVRDLGIDAIPLIEVTAATMASGSNAAALAVTHGLTGKLQLDAVLRASHSTRGTRVVVDPLLCCTSGTEASHSDQLQYPISNVTTNAQTGQTQNSTKFVPIGLKLSVQCDAVRRQVVRVKLTAEDGALQGETDTGLPLVSKRLFASTYDLPLGETVLCGSLRKQSHGRSTSKWLQWGGKRESDSVVWLLFCHVIQVSA